MCAAPNESGGQQSEGDGERYYTESGRIHKGFTELIFRRKIFAAANAAENFERVRV